MCIRMVHLRVQHCTSLTLIMVVMLSDIYRWISKHFTNQHKPLNCHFADAKLRHSQNQKPGLSSFLIPQPLCHSVAIYYHFGLIHYFVFAFKDTQHKALALRHTFLSVNRKAKDQTELRLDILLSLSSNKRL